MMADEVSTNGLFCGAWWRLLLLTRFIATPDPKVKIGYFAKTPHNDCKKLPEAAEDLRKTSYHQEAMKTAESLLNIASGKSRAIDQQLNEEGARIRAEKRNIATDGLESICEVVKLYELS